MSKNYEKEIQTMQRLINYGKSEELNESRGSSAVEYHMTAADGKTYGIVREGKKFYIKVAPPKDTPLVTEDYEYIGGFNNKKFNEYPTYTIASKQLDLKLKSINEAYASNKVSTNQYQETQPSEWQIQETVEMRRDIDRFNQLVGNVDEIMKQGYLTEEFTQKHTIPEAPGSANVSDKDVSSPFTDTAVANKGEVKQGNTNHEKVGTPFNGQAKVDMQSDKMPSTPGDNGVAYTDGTKFGPKFDKEGSVANKNPKGGKVARVNEGVRRTVRLTEEQVLAWNKNRDYMDKSHGTEIGDSAPFDDEVNPEKENDRNINTEYKMNEEVAMHATDNQNKPTPGTGDPQSETDPFDNKVKTVYEADEELDNQDLLTDAGDGSYIGDTPDGEIDDDLPPVIDIDVDEIGFEDEPKNPIDEPADLNGDDDLNSLRGRLRQDPNFGNESMDTLFPDTDDEDRYTYEGKQRRSNRKVNEGTVLHDFGKHPAYQKEVMTLPPNKEIDRWGRDWNDKSTKGDEPYGKQIGSSAPFTEEVIDMLTDAVMKKLRENRNNKKKV